MSSSRSEIEAIAREFLEMSPLSDRSSLMVGDLATWERLRAEANEGAARAWDAALTLDRFESLSVDEEVGVVSAAGVFGFSTYDGTMTPQRQLDKFDGLVYVRRDADGWKVTDFPRVGSGQISQSVRLLEYAPTENDGVLVRPRAISRGTKEVHLLVGVRNDSTTPLRGGSVCVREFPALALGGYLMRELGPGEERVVLAGWPVQRMLTVTRTKTSRIRSALRTADRRWVHHTFVIGRVGRDKST